MICISKIFQSIFVLVSLSNHHKLLYILIFIVSSCASYSDNFQISDKKIESFTPDFLNSFQEKSFKISIDAYGNNFGGIVVCKKINPNHYRFAFLNEFGGKMLDFELENQEMKVNYAMEQLDRKIILNMLQKDFNLLFNENNTIIQTFESDGYSVLQTEISENPVYYFLKNDSLQKTVLAPHKKEKINLQFSYANTDFPDVEISHGKVKIKIYLHLLDSN